MRHKSVILGIAVLCGSLIVGSSTGHAESTGEIPAELLEEVKELLIARGVAPRDFFAKVTNEGEPVYSCGPGDLNSDGRINGSDLSVVLAGYGCIAETPPEGEPPVCL